MARISPLSGESSRRLSSSINSTGAGLHSLHARRGSGTVASRRGRPAHVSRPASRAAGSVFSGLGAAGGLPREVSPSREPAGPRVLGRITSDPAESPWDRRPTSWPQHDHEFSWWSSEAGSGVGRARSREAESSCRCLSWQIS